MAKSSSFSRVDDEFSETDSSGTSSEYSDDEELREWLKDPEFGTRPYMYEPEVSDDGGSGSKSKMDDEEEQKQLARIGNNSWCLCKQCIAMPSARESKCCREIDAVFKKMESFELDIDCITDHPGFQTVCLDRWVLDIAYNQYKQEYEEDHKESENQKYCRIAYRQLARWCWEYLGKVVRVALPACAVNKIRQTFPTE